MAKNLLNKYVWLVETIYKAKGISYEELNEKWLDSELSDGVELPARTFHKWRVAVEETFGLNIDCERKGKYRYYISDTGYFYGPTQPRTFFIGFKEKGLAQALP